MKVAGVAITTFFVSADSTKLGSFSAAAARNESFGMKSTTNSGVAAN